jgi:hypothetical protein
MGRCLIKHEAQLYIFTENGEERHGSRTIEDRQAAWWTSKDGNVLMILGLFKDPF